MSRAVSVAKNLCRAFPSGYRSDCLVCLSPGFSILADGLEWAIWVGGGGHLLSLTALLKTIWLTMRALAQARHSSFYIWVAAAQCSIFHAIGIHIKKKAASLVSSWILIWTIALSGRKVIRRLISSHVLPKAKGQDGYDQATPGPRASTGTSSRTREFVQLCQEAERTQYSLSPAQVNYEKQAERSTCLCCSPSILSNLC